MSAPLRGRSGTWLEFWNAPNRIYVNQRHQQAHYDVLFARTKRFFPPAGDATVLDWGCGDALAADRMAKNCQTVLLYDAADATHSQLANRYGSSPRIKVLDEAGLAALTPGTVDLVIFNSVIQYLTRAQLDEALVSIGRHIRPDGRLLLGDVVEPHTSMTRDATNLLRFAWRNGFVVAAVVGLLFTFASRYRRLRRELGFARYNEGEIHRILSEHGFGAEALPENIGPSRYRRSYLAYKARGA